ncbi:ABC transporter ATP-binding protein [Streptomyces armeniacus]|uniref:ABC transporter ATP-binding protein n=1 Tax=Streptomyces armeniacus TaxID=83291 RepID=A0A345XJ52_9ACTN|nr:ABC transporter ATP-binding protein [Streptomyces armeniacus]AXK31668.1 ABC transporter ATP-binding protein [Streptomyces armeniacus]
MTLVHPDAQDGPPPSGASPLLSVRDLTVEYKTDAGWGTAVHRLSFDVGERQTLAVVGESGSGKSAAAMAIMGLLPSSARVTGSVRFRGRELLAYTEREMRTVRGRHISVIFQDALAALNPMMTVGDQIAEAISVHDPGAGRKSVHASAAELLDLVGIPAPQTRLRDYPHEFSGGMRQRVMIAIGMANEPDILIADEPTTALDVTVQAQVLEVIERVQERTGTSVLLITHDLGIVAGLADRVMVMYSGCNLEEGSAEAVFDRPAHPYTRGLLGALPRIDRRVPRLVQIPGQPPALGERAAGCPFQPRCAHVRPTLCGTEPPAPLQLSASHTTSCVRAPQIESEPT